MREKTKVDVKTEELVLDDTVKQNKKGEAILGRLQGPCADFVNPTRNGREYSEELWEKVFDNEIVKEYFDAGGILGELDHPGDRTETCTEKVAICMPEPPTKDKNGQLIATFDILDTPNGRIAYTLAKYGYKLGISSRGTGDVYDTADGTERVDEDTYDFQAFDLVLLPAVKSARLSMVESLSNYNKSFKQAICEALEKTDDRGKKIMTETLSNLNIDIGGSGESIDSKSDSKPQASDAGLGVVKDLQESLKREKELKAQLKSLQEKLSVSYTKETGLIEEINKYKKAIITLSDTARSAKGLQSKIDSLTEQLAQKDKDIESQRARCESLVASQKSDIQKRKNLTESLSNKDSEIKTLEDRIKELKQATDTASDSLKENLEEVKQNSVIKINEYKAKLESANKLIEKYKGTAKNAVSKYIESKATVLGVTVDEVKNRLPENYSFQDIDRICENLQDYQLSLSKLPFTVQSGKTVKVKVTESKESIKPIYGYDDEVDEQLLRLAEK